MQLTFTVGASICPMHVRMWSEGIRWYTFSRSGEIDLHIGQLCTLVSRVWVDAAGKKAHLKGSGALRRNVNLVGVEVVKRICTILMFLAQLPKSHIFTPSAAAIAVMWRPPRLPGQDQAMMRQSPSSDRPQPARRAAGAGAEPEAAT